MWTTRSARPSSKYWTGIGKFADREAQQNQTAGAVGLAAGRQAGWRYTHRAVYCLRRTAALREVVSAVGS